MKVFLLAAVTKDGFIGRTADERSFNWTSEADKKFYVSKIKSANAIVIGSKTFQTFHRYPRGSRWIIYTSHPENFTNPNPAVISAEGTKESPQELIARLEKEGVEQVAISGGASIYNQFLDAGVVDTIYLTVEPVTFGEGIAFTDKKLEETFDLVSEEKLGDEGTILKTYTKKM